MHDNNTTKKKPKQVFTKDGKVRNSGDAASVFMEEIFTRMIHDYDFMSLVMYPELKKRREFVHDAWLISKITENTELKVAISNDPYF